MIPKSGNRFSACAGIGRSGKIMRKKNIVLAICLHGNSV